jgi:hypothetical protein
MLRDSRYERIPRSSSFGRAERKDIVVISSYCG